MRTPDYPVEQRADAAPSPFRSIVALTFVVAGALHAAAGDSSSSVVVQEQKDKTETKEKKATTPEEKFAAYRKMFGIKDAAITEKIEKELLQDGVAGVRRFLAAYLHPQPQQGHEFSLHCRNVVIREARMGGKGNPETIAMIVDHLADPGHPSFGDIGQTIADIGTAAADPVYKVFDGSAWKNLPGDATDQLRRKTMSAYAADTLRSMLGADEKHISDDALHPRLHGTLVGGKEEAQDDVRATAAGLLMRRESGTPWLLKAAQEEKPAKLILTGLKNEMLQSKKGEFLTLSDSGAMVAKRYRNVIGTIHAAHTVLRGGAQDVLDLLITEEKSREKKLQELKGKKESTLFNPSSRSYRSTIDSNENARSAVTLAFSERRNRSEESMRRRIASLKARSLPA